MSRPVRSVDQDSQVEAPMSVLVGGRGRIVYCSNGDPLYGVPGLEDGSVHLVFTSPPYWNYQDYSGVGVGTEDTYPQYIASVSSMLGALYRKVCAGGRLVINASNMKSRRKVEGRAFVYPIVSDIIREACARGFTFFDEIIWVKGDANAGALGGKPLFGSYPYPPTPKILDSTFENILVFVKEGRREAVASGCREPSRLTKEQWAAFTKGVWRIAHDRDPVHPATFPMALAERVIRLYSFVGDLVVDPYAGTGTTVIAAERLGRSGVGFEIAERFRAGVAAKVDYWLGQPVNAGSEY